MCVCLFEGDVVVSVRREEEDEEGACEGLSDERCGEKVCSGSVTGHVVVAMARAR